MLFKDVVKKLYPGNKAKQKEYTETYNSAKTHMTHSSADSYARGEVRRKFNKPSDSIPKAGRKGYVGTVKAKISDDKSKYYSDLRRFNEGVTDRDPRKGRKFRK